MTGTLSLILPTSELTLFRWFSCNYRAQFGGTVQDQASRRPVRSRRLSRTDGIADAIGPSPDRRDPLDDQPQYDDRAGDEDEDGID